uniref:SFRICE_026114 n=1 Tax=Spodoptera frugiperda TaxID=7108 RepID=A0A2H1WNN3_SPOFR
MFQHEWTSLTGMILRPHRKSTWKNTCVVFRCVTETGSALITPLVFRVSKGSGHCLSSGDPSARLPAYTIKKDYM